MQAVNRAIMLRALGVQQWYAQYALAARRSPAFVRAAPLVEAKPKIQDITGRQQRQGFDTKAILVKPDVSVLLEQVTEPERLESRVEPVPVQSLLAPINRFELACYTTSSLIIFSAESAYDQSNQLVLLQNILKASGLGGEDASYKGEFCWPVFQGAKIEQDQNGILPELLWQWLRKTESVDRRVVIFMGIEGNLVSALNSKQMSEVVHVALPHSLSSLLRDTSGKAQTWQQLKAVLPRIKERLLG